MVEPVHAAFCARDAIVRGYALLPKGISPAIDRFLHPCVAFLMPLLCRPSCLAASGIADMAMTSSCHVCHSLVMMTTSGKRCKPVNADQVQGTHFERDEVVLKWHTWRCKGQGVHI